MATRKAAEHTLYHWSPKGFWKKFRDNVVVNPEISSGLPLPAINRMPPPGSRPEHAATPATKASDPAQNPYWKRDVRRAYPQLSVVSQSDLARFLLQAPEQPPKEGAEGAENKPVPTRTPDLIAAIDTLASKKQFNNSALPPIPRTPFKRWVPETSPPAPHDPAAYFPMDLVR